MEYNTLRGHLLKALYNENRLTTLEIYNKIVSDVSDADLDGSFGATIYWGLNNMAKGRDPFVKREHIQVATGRVRIDKIGYSLTDKGITAWERKKYIIPDGITVVSPGSDSITIDDIISAVGEYQPFETIAIINYLRSNTRRVSGNMKDATEDFLISNGFAEVSNVPDGSGKENCLVLTDAGRAYKRAGSIEVYRQIQKQKLDKEIAAKRQAEIIQKEQHELIKSQDRTNRTIMLFTFVTIAIGLIDVTKDEVKGFDLFWFYYFIIVTISVYGIWLYQIWQIKHRKQ